MELVSFWTAASFNMFNYFYGNRGNLEVPNHVFTSHPTFKLQLDYADEIEHKEFKARFERRSRETLRYESRTHPFTRYFTTSVPVYVYYVFQLLGTQPLQWSLWEAHDVFIGPAYPQPDKKTLPFNDRLVCCTSRVSFWPPNVLLRVRVQVHMLAHALEYYVRFMSPRPWNSTQEAKMSYAAGWVAREVCASICVIPKCPDPGRWLTKEILLVTGLTEKNYEYGQDLRTFLEMLYYEKIYFPHLNSESDVDIQQVPTAASKVSFLLKSVILERFDLTTLDRYWYFDETYVYCQQYRKYTFC